MASFSTQFKRDTFVYIRISVHHYRKLPSTTSEMDIKNLETASDYINNLLLSRGLLRNGEPISFAHPSQGEGGKQATIAKVINLVHDLILRRDVSRHLQGRLESNC